MDNRQVTRKRDPGKRYAAAAPRRAGTGSTRPHRRAAGTKHGRTGSAQGTELNKRSRQAGTQGRVTGSQDRGARPRTQEAQRRSLPAAAAHGSSRGQAGSGQAARTHTSAKPVYLLTAPILIPAACKWICFFLVLFVIVRMTAVTAVSNTPFDTMAQVVTAAADLSNTAEADNQMIRRLYGLTPSDYDGILLYCPKTNMGAEELFLIRLKSASQEASVLEQVNKRVETQKNSFQGYGVDQTEMLEDSVVESAGNYILFYSGHNPRDVLHAFRNAL